MKKGLQVVPNTILRKLKPERSRVRSIHKTEMAISFNYQKVTSKHVCYARKMLTNRALDSHSARHNDYEFEKTLNLFSSRNVFSLMERKKSFDQFDV